MQNFSKPERIAAAVYFIWFFVHLGLFFYSDESTDNSFFWPFIPGDKTMALTYDVTEFAVYTGAPFILFIAYRIVFSKSYEESQANRRHSANFFIAFLDEKIKTEELTQKINELQQKPVSHERLNELRSDREKAASNNVNNWLDRIEIRRKYKSFEN